MAIPQLSVVIPVYNEEQGLPALFDRLYPALDKFGIAYEIVFVNVVLLNIRCNALRLLQQPDSASLSQR